MFSGEFCLRLKPYLVVKIASDVLTEHCSQVWVLAMMFCRPTAGCVLAWSGKWLRNQQRSGNPSYQRTTCFGLLTLRQANMRYEKYSLHLIFTFYLNRDTSVLELFPVVSIKKILCVDSSRRARDTAAMLDHTRHRGESATKTVKFFVAHTVNCVICNNHTIIDWMLHFTPVIQQNCHQPGRKFAKSFCAVDRLSCQLELSNSETSQFRSDLVFDIVNYVHVIFLHGG